MISPRRFHWQSKIVLADIYAARETDTLGISSDDIRSVLLQWEKMPGISAPLTKLRIFFGKLCPRGSVDNYRAPETL